MGSFVILSCLLLSLLLKTRREVAWNSVNPYHFHTIPLFRKIDIAIVLEGFRSLLLAFPFLDQMYLKGMWSDLQISKYIELFHLNYTISQNVITYFLLTHYHWNHENYIRPSKSISNKTFSCHFSSNRASPRKSSATREWTSCLHFAKFRLHFLE